MPGPERSPPARFAKLEALGNDFVLLDGRDGHADPDAMSIRALADRHTGIGFDQLLCLKPATDPSCDCMVSIYNCDGSPARQCGNGMRAIAIWLHAQQPRQHAFRVMTAAGPIGLEVIAAGQVRAEMGEPRFGPEAIGLSPGLDALGLDQALLPGLVEAGAVSMGNPHLVLLLDRPADAALVSRLGQALSGHPALSDGANVSFARRVAADRLDLQVYERGVGPTRACGSAACASAAWVLRDHHGPTSVHVIQPGGPLVIDWRGPGTLLFMTGPARHVFDGTLT